MATPSGTIGLSDVNIELGYPSTDLISMNDAAVRTLADVPSGTISMDDLRGKSNRVTITLTIASDTTNYDLYTASAPAYSAGKSDIFLTINPGVNVYSNSTGTAAVAVPSSFTTGDVITITNNGTIVGRGGSGNGGSGGTGLAVSYPTTVANNNQIAGGGGAGGSGGKFAGNPDVPGGGGGGAAYGAGGPPNGNPAGFSTGGNGGSGNTVVFAPYSYITAGNGGAGAGWGSSGTPGNAAYGVEFGGYPGPPGNPGGASGNSITGNSYITWTANGTKTGPVS